jgi:YD repeat-containing protein
LKTETVTGSIQDGKNGAVTYGYDNVGNRLTRSSSLSGITNQALGYDANDRLNGDQYDNNGNTRNAPVSQPAAINPQQLLGTDDYDSENRLIQRTGTNGSAVRLVYDGDGNRVQEIVDGQTKSYLIDDRNPTGYAQVVEEIVNGVVNHTYTYGHDLISQDQVDPLTNTWHATFYAYDGHGSVRFLTNESGQVTDTYVYDAFGTLITARRAPVPLHWRFWSDLNDTSHVDLRINVDDACLDLIELIGKFETREAAVPEETQAPRIISDVVFDVNRSGLELVGQNERIADATGNVELFLSQSAVFARLLSEPVVEWHCPWWKVALGCNRDRALVALLFENLSADERRAFDAVR